jgi:tetratricopeptide (TPR) repeat protein
MNLQYRGNLYQGMEAEPISAQASSSDSNGSAALNLNLVNRGLVNQQGHFAPQGTESFEDLAETAVKHYQAARYFDALTFIKRALEQGIQAPHLWAVQADCLAQIGRFDEAIASIERAITMEPGNVEFQRDRDILKRLRRMHDLRNIMS